MLRKRIVRNLTAYKKCRTDIKGFLYTVVAIEQYYNKLPSSPSIMPIYSEVGGILHTSRLAVERGIRFFIDKLDVDMSCKEFIASESYRLMEE